MNYTVIKYEIADRVLTITFNRPEKLNAFNTEFGAELLDAFNRADKDDEVRAIIVTGAGRGFCAGADLSGKPFDYSDTPIDQHRDGGGLLTLRLYDMKKPMIAAINGPAVGVGVTMTLPMDIRLASENAKFGLVFAKRGIVPEACSSWFLPRIVGISQAAEWAFTGRIFDAQEALAGKLVSRVLAPDDLLPTARKIALEIAENAPLSVALTRQMLWKMLGADHPMEAHKIDSKGVYTLGQTADAREGVSSFKEKRKADFRGKPSSDMPEFYPFWRERSFGSKEK